MPAPPPTTAEARHVPSTSATEQLEKEQTAGAQMEKAREEAEKQSAESQMAVRPPAPAAPSSAASATIRSRDYTQSQPSIWSRPNGALTKCRPQTRDFS